MKSYDPYITTIKMKPHQAVAVGDIIDDNGVKLKVLELKGAEIVETKEPVQIGVFRYEEFTTALDVIVEIKVRELPDES